MTNLSSTQRMWLQSVLQNAMQSETPLLRIRVTNADGSVVLAEASPGEKERLFRVHLRDTSEMHLDAEATVGVLLDCVTANYPAIRIDDGKCPVIHRVERGKVIREVVEEAPVAVKTPGWAIGKSTHLDPAASMPLLQSIGLMTPEGEIRAPMRKKFKQINHFLELVSPILRQAERKQTFQLVDCGCGRSYLGFVLYWYIRKVLNQRSSFLGVDVSSHVIERSRTQAEQLQLPDMEFQCASILEADYPASISLLVSLHACDTATDEALAIGAACQADHIVCVPCCQHELARQIPGVPHYPNHEHRLFTHRFADLLTDMNRSLFLEAHGYGVKVGEFVSYEDTPKNLMLRASRVENADEDRKAAHEAFKQEYGISPSLDWFYQMRATGVGT